MIFKKINLVVLFVSLVTWSSAQNNKEADGQHKLLNMPADTLAGVKKFNPDPLAAWFPKAGLGLFIHWGAIAAYGGGDISWCMLANKSWPGVLVAFTIPAMTRIDENIYSNNLRKLSYEFEKEIPSNSTLTTAQQHRTIQHVKSLSLAAETPLQKIEHALHPWVAFLIMPLFALSNSGILIGSDFFSSVVNPVTIGVTSGLIIGKFTGILLFTWIMVKTGIGVLPAQATWKHIMGIALLAGVGFTMSLFICGLAFKDPVFVQHAKYGILIASVLAGLGGYLFLRRVGRN